MKKTTSKNYAPPPEVTKEATEMCPEHPTYPLIQFCKTCKEFKCRFCSCQKSCHSTENIEIQNGYTIKMLKDLSTQISGRCSKENIEKLENYKTELIKMKKNREEERKSFLGEITRILDEDEAKYNSKIKEINTKIAAYIEETQKKNYNLELMQGTTDELIEKLQKDHVSLMEMMNGYYYLISTRVPPKDSKEDNEYRTISGKFDFLGKYVGNLENLQKMIQNLEGNFKPNDENINIYKVLPMTKEVISFNCTKNKGKKLNLKEAQDKMPYFCGLAYTDSRIFVAGGTPNLKDHLKEAFSLNFPDMNKYGLPDLVVERSQNVLAYVGGILLCFGGINSSGFVRSVESIEKNQTVWSEAGRWNEPKAFASAVACEKDNTVYVFGGYTEKETSNRLDVFSVIAKSWTQMIISDLPYLHSAGIALIEPKPGDSNAEREIHIFGGSAGLRQEDLKDDVYVIHKKKAEKFGKLLKPDTFYGSCTRIVERDIYAFGRCCIHKYENKWSAIEEYDWYPL